MENHHADTPEVPNWLMLTAFTLMVVILFAFGDVLTAVVGIILIGVVFANYYTEHASSGH
jgi:hypothetical protein